MFGGYYLRLPDFGRGVVRVCVCSVKNLAAGHTITVDLIALCSLRRAATTEFAPAPQKMNETKPKHDTLFQMASTKTSHTLRVLG